MSKHLALLMYHGLYSNEAERAAIDEVDRPYALSVAQFEHQLDVLGQAGLLAADPHALASDQPPSGGVVLTFDDGHQSNHHLALPVLQRRKLRAAFFVTTDFIGQRRGFCSWGDLRAMDQAGMLIGTHGKTHRFFDDMGVEEARAEFLESKDAVEQQLGHAVDQMSFPGGRFQRAQLALGHQLGYRVFHSSEVGVARCGPLKGHRLLPRIAVKPAMSDTSLLALATAQALPLARAQAIATTKQLLRRAMGNKLYHALYERLSA